MKLLYLGAALFLLLACGCKKADPLPPDTSNVHQQIDWPGLASTPWPMFMHDPQHTGRSPSQGPDRAVVQWRFDATNSVYSSPVVDIDGTVYVGSEDANLYAVNADGSLKWKFVTNGPIVTSPLISSDGTIFVVQGQGQSSAPSALFALGRSGTLKWKFDLDGIPIGSSPTISKDGKTVYVASGIPISHTTKLYAINNDGNLHWTFGGTSGGDDIYVHTPSFSLDGKTLYVSGTQKVFGLDTSGNKVWEYSTGHASSSSAVDDQGNVYFSGPEILCLTPTGSLIWSYALTSSEPYPMPGIGWDGSIFVVSSEAGPPWGSYLHAFNKTGSLKWTQFVGAFSEANPVSDNDGVVYVGSDGRFPGGVAHDSTSVFAINPNGVYKFRLVLHNIDGSVPDITSTPAIGLGKTLYVGCDRPHGESLFSIH